MRSPQPVFVRRHQTVGSLTRIRYQTPSRKYNVELKKFPSSSFHHDQYIVWDSGLKESLQLFSEALGDSYDSAGTRRRLSSPRYSRYQLPPCVKYSSYQQVVASARDWALSARPASLALATSPSCYRPIHPLADSFLLCASPSISSDP
ncbi:hypothetical protein J6590_055518 [Homalodisca vitripennis]|nr:hypothetical protein J6590_055518 [Homalodisca vitripennis]